LLDSGPIFELVNLAEFNSDITCLPFKLAPLGWIVCLRNWK